MDKDVEKNSAAGLTSSSIVSFPFLQELIQKFEKILGNYGSEKAH